MIRPQPVAALLLTLAFSATVQAQAPRSGGSSEAQKFMQQYQQIAGEKTALQTQLAQMKKDLDAAQQELAATKKERDALKAQARGGVSPVLLQQANASKESAEKSLEQYKQRMNELVSKFRDMAGNLKDVEADRAKLRVDLQQRDAGLDKCAADNLSLYDLNKEILDRYEHVGLFTKVSSAEPFTQLTRTR